MDTILVLDFGGQTAQLICRRIRDAGVYSIIAPGDQPLAGDVLEDVRGIVLSGSPHSVYEPAAPRPDPSLHAAGVPILGICYGLQRLVTDAGGRVAAGATREYGRSRIHIRERSPLFDGVEDGFVSWMSHSDVIERPAGMTTLAVSENGHPAAMQDGAMTYGLQFHPEVSHCEFGTRILSNFAVEVCRARREWNMDRFLEAVAGRVRRQVGGAPVVTLISGGVDSAVVAALLLRILEPDQVHLLYVDTGLMRDAETREVMASLRALGATNLHAVDASRRFFAALSGVTDPECKRTAVGDEFVRVAVDELGRLGIAGAYLAQGTLYTDLIESGKGVGSRADVIKSHHNVRSPLIEAKRSSGVLVEPLADLYKDEVRRLGRKLGLSARVVGRHPFPGPGLSVRILGEVTSERCRTLRAADRILIEELRRRGLYDAIWQAFCVLLPVQSVGVAGDVRRYGSVVAIRAITSEDGMTADVYPMAASDLLEISSRITNAVPEVGRVVYDVSSKPPATIEWE